MRAITVKGQGTPEQAVTLGGVTPAATMPLTLDASAMLTNFSANVAALRKALGFSQEDLAAKLKVARTTISNWEKGVAYPSFADLLELALVLKVTMDELVGVARPAASANQNRFNARSPGDANIVMLDRSTVDTLPSHVDLSAHFKGMPAFNLPGAMFADGVFICLQHLGDSMAPTLRPGEWLIAKHVPKEVTSLQVGDVYIVATRLGVVCRRCTDLAPAPRGQHRVRFASDNTTYSPMDTPLTGITHLFQCRARLHYQFDNPMAGMATQTAAAGTNR
jgi:transcriptional regulator with XRE-family HTH domain